MRDGELVEKTQAPPSGGAFSYVPDIAPFTTHDGKQTVLISSRTERTAFEQRYGVRQIGDQAKPVGPAREQ